MNNQKISKVIHCCWFGGNPMDELAIKCIESWKIYCNDYEIKIWNEENFDINSVRFTKEAYAEKKWAFISDYVRLWALYNEGGVYLDTDVELIKPLDDLLEDGAVFGFENKLSLTTGFMAGQKGNKFIGEILEYYKDKSFYDENGKVVLTPNPKIVTSLAKNNKIKLNGKEQTICGNVHIYPKDYFAPKSYMTNEINLTKNTYAVHHFVGSWMDENSKKSLGKLKHFLIKCIGEDCYLYLAYKKEALLSINN